MLDRRFSIAKLSSNLHYSSRQHPVVQQLIEIIGRDVKLYTMFTEMIRIVFLSTPHPILSTLKFDVLMRLHEDDVREVSALFTWVELLHTIAEVSYRVPRYTIEIRVTNLRGHSTPAFETNPWIQLESTRFVNVLMMRSGSPSFMRK